MFATGSEAANIEIEGRDRASLSAPLSVNPKLGSKRPARFHTLGEWPGSDPGPFTRSVENRRNPDPFQAGRRKAAGLPRSHARPSRGASSSLSGIAKKIWTGGVTGRTTPPTITETSVASYLNNGKAPRISWMITGRSTT